VKTKMVLTGIE